MERRSHPLMLRFKKVKTEILGGPAKNALSAVSFVENCRLRWIFLRKVIPFWPNTKPPRTGNCSGGKMNRFTFCEAFQTALLRSIPNSTFCEAFRILLFAKRPEFHFLRSVQYSVSAIIPNFTFCEASQTSLFAKRPDLRFSANRPKFHFSLSVFYPNEPGQEF